MPDRAKPNRQSRSGRRFILSVLLFSLVGFGTAYFFSPSEKVPSFDPDRFMITSEANYGISANAGVMERIWHAWERVKRGAGIRPNQTYSFGAALTNRCSIYGLLNQCTDVSGVRYVIAKDVAAGSVKFGHTNTLNGAQWVDAFTTALKTGIPQWWVEASGSFRKENLVLVTNGPTTVFVVPKEMAQEIVDGKFGNGQGKYTVGQ